MKSKWIVIACLALAFLRTAEAMVAFSPRSFFGYQSDTFSLLWAFAAALLIEGVIYVAYDKLATRGKDQNTKNASWVAVVLALSFSAVMNLIDTRALSADGASSAFQVLRGVITLIPLITAAIFGAIDVIDRAFPDAQQRPGKSQHRQFQPPARPRPQPALDDLDAEFEAFTASHSNGHSKMTVFDETATPGLKLVEKHHPNP